MLSFSKCFLIQVYYVRLASDGTPEGNLSFTLSKNGAKNIGAVVVNDGNTVTIIALCKF